VEGEGGGVWRVWVCGGCGCVDMVDPSEDCFRNLSLQVCGGYGCVEGEGVGVWRVDPSENCFRNLSLQVCGGCGFAGGCLCSVQRGGVGV